MGKRINTAVWLEKYSRWQIKVQKDGERRTFTCSAPGRNGQRECNRKADEWLDEGISNANRKISDFYELYINDLKSRTSRSHWQNEQTYGKVWILPEIGKLKLSSISDQHLQRVINAAYQAGKSRKTLKNLRSTFSGFFKFCRKCKATKFCPEDIVIPNGAPIGSRTIVQPEDISKLFQSDKTTFYNKEITDVLINAYRLQITTGMRPGEVLGLQWGDIQNDMIYIRRSINVFGEMTGGKNENAIRTFAINPAAQIAIDSQKNISSSKESTDFIFPRMPEQTYLHHWKRYCSANAIPSTTLYELRHTFVSIVQSLPEGHVKELVGHSKNMDTFGIYGHETSGMKQQIAQNVGQIFDDILGKEK